MLKSFLYWIQVILYVVRLFGWIQLERWKNPKKIFIGIAMDGDLGDIIASEPILPELAAKYHPVHITWICHPSYFPIFQFHPLVDRMWEQKFTLLTHILLRLNPFDHFFALHLSDFRQDSVTKISIKNPKADALNLRLDNYYHEHTLLEVASQLADLGKLNIQPQLYLDQIPYSLPFEGAYWVIHTKSNNGMRDWRDDYWLSLLNFAMDTWSIQCVEIGQKNPLPFERPGFKSLVGKTSLIDSMKIIRGASFFIGLDSGPTHIANAFKIPALVICGEFQNFKTYRSYSGAYQNPDVANILFNPSGKAEELSLETVKIALFDAVQKTQINLEKL